MTEGHTKTTRDAAYASTWRRDASALGSLLSGEVFARGIGQVALLVTARVLGPDDFGVLAVALTVFGIAAATSDLGLGETAAARLTRRPGGVDRFTKLVAPLRLRAALVAAAALLVAAALAHDRPVVAVSCLTGAAIPGSIAITARTFAARIDKNFPAAARWSVLNGLCLWIGPLIGAVVFRSALAAAVSMSIAVTAAALLSGSVRVGGHVPSRIARAWMRAALPLVVAALAVAVYSRVDRLFVAAADGSAAAGIYSAAYNVVMLVAVAGSTLQAGLLPRLLHEHAHDSRVLWRTRLVGILGVSSLLAALVWWAAPTVVAALYGPAFRDSAQVLRWLAPLVMLYVANPFLSAVLMSRRLSIAIGATSLVNLVVALAGYPLAIAAFGIAGAAMTSVLVELIGLLHMVAWLLATDRRSP